MSNLETLITHYSSLVTVLIDVIIVGAGPAGSATATFLSQKGYQVLLLDKARFPREKICGEFISPEIPAVLDRLGVLKTICEKNPWQIQGILISSYQNFQFKLDFPSIQSSKHPLMAGSQGFNIPRFIFDELLLRNAQQASVEVLEGFKVTDLIFQGDQICGIKGIHQEGHQVEFKSRLVVGAGGRNCIVAKRLNLHVGYRWLRKAALMTYFKGIQDPGRYVEMHVNPPGYCGIAPVGEDLVNVSLVVDLEIVRSNPGDLSDYFLKSIFNNRLIKEKLSGGRMSKKLKGVGPLAFKAKRCSWGGALLVGDSAGFIDPFTGEGIYHALRSGELAAEIIHEAFKINNMTKEFLQKYDHLRIQEFRRKFRICHVLQPIIYRPWLANLVAQSMARDSILKDWLVPWN
ncbi:MAG: NAD(P)/FAD-dependent oxidoreductase [Nitrospira sp.]|nr:NAD(P)/FAD-dependent oxidoreductase [Nitrospira sp.]